MVKVTDVYIYILFVNCAIVKLVPSGAHNIEYGSANPKGF